MSISVFLTNLWESGHVRVPRWNKSQTTTDEWTEVDDLIRRASMTDRRSLAFEPPDVCFASARWSAEMLYRTCQLLVDRGIGMDHVNLVLAKRCPKEQSHQTIYSVDLTMRYLPDVAQIARAVNPDDSIIAELNRLGGDWPLSSVGMSGVMVGPLDLIFSNRTLRMIYMDRVLERKDRSRLEDPRILAIAAAVIGEHPELVNVGGFHCSGRIEGDEM